MYQDFLEGLLKHRLRYGNHGVSDPVVLRQTWDFHVSNKFPGDADVPGWWPHLEKPRIMVMKARGTREAFFSVLAYISGSFSRVQVSIIFLMPFTATVAKLTDYIFGKNEMCVASLKIRHAVLCEFTCRFILNTHCASALESTCSNKDIVFFTIKSFLPRRALGTMV